MSDEPDNTGSAPGWDAIDAALWPIYGDREPLHVGTIVPYRLGGPDPIHGISAYKNLESVPHWHFVTYGFSELWEKQSTDREVSGFGFELTFRCACDPDAEKPSFWAFNFLQSLGRYVFETGNVFGAGHTMPLNGPIQHGSPTPIHVAAFTHDPQLPAITTPNGRVEFLQIVGLTMDELEAIHSWNAEAFLHLRSHSDSLLITDLTRESWMNDKRFATEVARRSKKDGSSCGWLSLVLQCDTKGDKVHVRVQSIAVNGLKRRLLSRLPYGRELVLNGKEATVVFKPGEKSKLELIEGAAMIILQESDVIQLAESIRPVAGVHRIPGIQNAFLHVLRTEITDDDGKVVDVVG